MNLAFVVLKAKSAQTRTNCPGDNQFKRSFVSGSCYEGQLDDKPVYQQYYFRLAGDRGAVDHGWLQSYYSFSFSPFYKAPEHRGFRKLRVINEDFIQPGKGFETHPHQHMEIITYVLKGQVAHKDSLGNGSVIRPGEVQRMSAGSGITHSEFNASYNEICHLLQIWILPDQIEGVKPSYEQIPFQAHEKVGKLKMIASPSGEYGSVKILQDVKLYVTQFKEINPISWKIQPGRAAYIHVVSGHVTMNGYCLQSGDGVGVASDVTVTIQPTEQSISNQEDPEVLLFDLN